MALDKLHSSSYSIQGKCVFGIRARDECLLLVEGCDHMSEWISCKDMYPTPNKPFIVYGDQLCSHWPGIAYAIWCEKSQSWFDCFAYGGETYIRKEEVTHWTELKLPPGNHE